MALIMFSLEQRKLNLDSVAMLPGKSVISQKTNSIFSVM